MGLADITIIYEELTNFFGQSLFGTYSVVNERNVVTVDKDVDLAVGWYVNLEHPHFEQDEKIDVNDLLLANKTITDVRFHHIVSFY
ncbi:hypothetical protein [Cytobacillus purgationiresistens]|nr:hypothetical protein [Cytobacillus purgationiresistens]